MQKELLCVLVQGISCWILVGICWFVQVVHYPLFDKIKDGFIDYERAYIRKTVFILAPLMLIEAITAIWLVGLMPPGFLTELATANLFLLIAIWLTTFLFMVHQHKILSVRFSKKSLRTLILINWVRTCFWSLKALLVGYIITLIMHA